MQEYGIKPYRRRGRKYNKNKVSTEETKVCPNHLLNLKFPEEPNRIWVSDFTYIPYRNKFIYLATILDLYSRKVVGFNVWTKHDKDLVSNALMNAVMTEGKIAKYIHSDQGKEYKSKYYQELCKKLGIKISMSNKSSPWENGYQESFYSQFKVDLGDPNRYETLGELVYAIYQSIYYYNNLRIHSAFNTSPNNYLNSYYFVDSLS